MKVQAPIKVDRKTKRLAKRLTGREIAVINHVDIDEVAANSLVEGKIKLVINASESISGRYPNKGPGILTENNILIIDNVGEELFHNLAEGQIIEVIDGNIYRDGELLGSGEVLDKQQVSEKLKKAYFSFIDYGVGIINSLRNDEHGKFYNIIPKIRELFNPQNNAEMLSLLLKGEIHKTSTGKYYRGKGLPCLFKACEDNKIANVVVIANDAKVEYTAGTNVKLNNSFAGTFIHWELNFNNVNINYE